MVLTPFVSETVWGGRRLIDEYSVVTDKRNAAEAWVMSAHKNGSSTVANGEFAGETLREVYLAHPEIGGKNCAGFSDFPVLIKFIDAAADLSVQVHPDDAYCLKKGAGAGKTESGYILDCEPGAHLLLGFERLDQRRQRFERIAALGQHLDATGRLQQQAQLLARQRFIIDNQGSQRRHTVISWRGSVSVTTVWHSGSQVTLRP